MVTIKTFVDKETGTLTHLVYDKKTKDAIVFDPVLDLDTIGWRTHKNSLYTLDGFISEQQLKLHYVLDTHIHADHLSGMQHLKNKYNAPLVINAAITLVQETFKEAFNFDEDFDVTGSDFDVLVKDGEQLNAGSINIEVLHTPGHTPACTSYKIDDNVFTGDALFVPSIGTGRCDFPKGSAKDLYNSVTKKLYTLSDETKVFPGHDYPGKREVQTFTTIAESKQFNVDLPANRNEADYIKFIENRDKKLMYPRLIFPGVQINLTEGKLPKQESTGQSYLKIPINNG